MIIRNLDNNGDWTFGKGKSSYLRNRDALKLNIKTRLFEWKNDCFFNIDAGVDWNNRLNTGQQQDLLEREIRNVILKSQGVTGLTILDVIFNSNTRNFNVSYSISSIYGEINDTV